MTIKARRRSPRARLPECAYLNFGSGIRATILDISETGLRFKAPSGFQSAGSRKLKFTFDRGGEMTADVAWTDETSMTGGLRFESISLEVLGQIRQWLDQSWTKQRMTRGSAQPAALTEPSQTTARALDGAVFTETQTVVRATPVIKPIETIEMPPPATSERKETGLSMFSKEPYPSVSTIYFPKRNRRLRQAAWVALVLVVLLATATVAAGYFYPDETRDAVRRAHDTISRLFTRPSGHATLNGAPTATPAGPVESKE
jgi:hypothetical protein